MTAAAPVAPAGPVPQTGGGGAVAPRLVELVLLAALMGQGLPALCGGGLWILASLARDRVLDRRLVALLLRLGWLWFSLLVLYFWFTPGDRLFPGLGGLSPTLEGVAGGWMRVAFLAGLAAAANGLGRAFPREELLAGLLWLLAPLERVHLPVARLGLRLVLVFDHLARLQPLFEQARRRRGPVVERVAAVFRAALEQGAGAGAQEMVLVHPLAPPRRAWLRPALLLLWLAWLVAAGRG